VKRRYEVQRKKTLVANCWRSVRRPQEWQIATIQVRSRWGMRP
jgi:hypothetical protein